MYSKPIENDGIPNMTTLSSTQNTEMSKTEIPDGEMVEGHVPKLSPISVKARSVPSTPSQRPQSPLDERTSSPTRVRAVRDTPPRSLRATASRTPPLHKRLNPCKYETGMALARRRIPYNIGAEPLEADTRAAAKTLHPKEEVRLVNDIRALYARLLPTQESESRRRKLVQKLEHIFHQRWPGQEIDVSVFGSTGNKLGTNESDVDICITTSYRDIEQVCAIADLLANNGMDRVVCVRGAKVPIVKIWDPELQVACDMNVNNPIALENTELIRSYVAIDDRFRPLAMIVKYWAKRRVLNDAALGGTLSSYTWICLVLSFLQTQNPPILPSLQNQPGLEARMLNGVDVAFDKNLSRYQGYGKANKSSLGQLLFQFFHFYAHKFDFENNVVCVRLGKIVSKSSKAWHTISNNRLCVEEPFNLTRNLANTADDTSMRGIHMELRRACDLLASGRLEECCEEYVPAQIEISTRRLDTFVAPPVTKAIIPQLPPQLQNQTPRLPKNGYKTGRNHRQGGNRRSSNPVGRTATHLRDLPFAMTPQELQLQQQHQQHLLHDQLFQQYQYLQMQEQELRMQLYRQRGLMAAGAYTQSNFSSTASTDDDQESLSSSRMASNARLPMTAPLYQSRFSSNPVQLSPGMSPSGNLTNPTSPALATTLMDSQRFARRSTLNSAAASTLRAQSQPARSVPGTPAYPPLMQRFDVPVRQVDQSGLRRPSTVSRSSQDCSALLNGRNIGGNFRNDTARRPMEYVGYYVGQSPSLSAYPGSTNISPVPSTAGLAIQNGGISPHLSTRSSRRQSVTSSPGLPYNTTVNGSAKLATLEEVNGSTHVETLEGDPPSPSIRSGPLIVDGSINSPPRRQIPLRPVRPSSVEYDVSGTTSEDMPFDTPSSSDEHSNQGQPRLEVDFPNHRSSDHILPEKEYASLNGASAQTFGHVLQDNRRGGGFSQSVSQSASSKHDDDDKTAQLGLLHGTQQDDLGQSTVVSHQLPTGPTTMHFHPLSVLTNGQINGQFVPLMPANGWQTQHKKKKRNKKQQKAESQEDIANPAGGEVMPADESERKGG